VSAATRFCSLKKPGKQGIDFRYRIFNADGGEVEQCGNGARCFVRFVHDQGLTAKREIRVETMAGVIGLRLEDDGTVSCRHGGAGIRSSADSIRRCVTDDLVQALLVGDEDIAITAVGMGNPHAVQVVADVDLRQRSSARGR
jgi:diaminopimelate epimerase